MRAEGAKNTGEVQREWARRLGQPVRGTSVDIHKCFDQLVREHVYHVLEEAGCPEPLLVAYKGFLEHLVVHNFVNGHVSVGHHHRCGIPQGCPPSMPFVSLLLRPWAQLVKEHGCKPRSLADDLLIVAEGEGRAKKLSQALDATLTFLSDMGGKVAPIKSRVFSTCARTRSWLSRKFWKPIGAGIRVANHFRDLGTHLNLTFMACGKTLNDRLWWPRRW